MDTCANPICLNPPRLWIGRGPKPKYCSRRCGGLGNSFKRKYPYITRGRDPESGEVVVYVLRDGSTNEPRYVGSTTSRLMRRMSQHNSTSGAQTVREWLQSCATPPIIEAIQYVSKSDRNHAEQQAINYGRSKGYDLLNLKETDGIFLPEFCVNGHPVNDETLYLRKSSRNQDRIWRDCKLCMKERSKKFYTH